MHPATVPARARPRHPWAAAIAAVLTVGALAACGGELTPSAGGRAGPGAPEAPPTTTAPVRATETPTTTPSRTTTATTKPPKQKHTRAPQPHVHSDGVGRRFDLGVIVSVTKEKGVPVIVLDRWTAKGVADATVARDGYPLAPHSGSPFTNLNTRSTYRIPVARGATFTYQHCADISKPMVTESSSLERMAELPKPEQVLLITLDPQGRATAVRNDPAC